MTSTGNVHLSANVSGDAGGVRSLDVTIPLTTAVNWVQTIALTTGDNTVTVPTGTTVCVIIPPNAQTPVPSPKSGAVLKTKNTGADAGEPISNTWVTVKTWDTAPASFLINTSANCTVTIWGA